MMNTEETEIKELMEGKPNLIAFSAAMQELASRDKDIIAVTSDSRGSGKLMPFAEKYPDQIVEVGIAEQNLVGVAAGLASAGKKAFAVSPACFLTARSLEQIKNDVAYSDNPVNLIGISAGVSYGSLGTTHHSLHDYAVCRAINNLIVVAPADNFETEQSIKKAAALDRPVYIRFGKKPMPFLNPDDNSYEFGKARIITEGDDLVLIGTGETVYPALLAARQLKTEHGINTRVISMHTIKPLDTDVLDRIVADGTPVITVEEHMVHGGLGEACASYLFQNGCTGKFKIMGIPDEYTITGSQLEIFDHYGISQSGIADVALNLLNDG